MAQIHTHTEKKIHVTCCQKIPTNSRVLLLVPRRQGWRWQTVVTAEVKHIKRRRTGDVVTFSKSSTCYHEGKPASVALWYHLKRKKVSIGFFVCRVLHQWTVDTMDACFFNLFFWNPTKSDIKRVLLSLASVQRSVLFFALVASALAQQRILNNRHGWYGSGNNYGSSGFHSGGGGSSGSYGGGGSSGSYGGGFGSSGSGGGSSSGG